MFSSQALIIRLNFKNLFETSYQCELEKTCLKESAIYKLKIITTLLNVA